MYIHSKFVKNFENLLKKKRFVFQNGYKLAIKKIENCGGPEQIIRISPNSTAELTNECKVILNGCGQTKAFQTGNVSDFNR